MRRSLLLPAFALLTGAVHGAGFIADFSGLINADDADPNTTTDVMDGYDGWSQSEGNPDGSVYGNDNSYSGGSGTAPLSWGANVAGNRGASLGFFYDIPASSPFYAAHGVTGVSFGNSFMMADFIITDSSDLYPARNDFSFGIFNAAGDNLFSWQLDAELQTSTPDSATGDWFGRTTSVATNSNGTYKGGAREGGFYRIAVTFSSGANGTVNYAGAFSSLLDNSLDQTFSGTLSGVTGLNAEDIAEFRVTSIYGEGVEFDQFGDPTLTPAWGDNFISFTNVMVIPEPASSALLGLGLAGFLMRRRR